MLLTDVWEALEYMKLEPPTHILLRPVAQFFGYKPEESPQAEPGKRNPTQAELATLNLPQFGPRLSADKLPAHIRKSPTFQKMVQELREQNAR